MSDNKSQPRVSNERILLSGLITGSIARSITHPVDTIKARMQVIRTKLNLSNLHQFGLIKTGMGTFHAEGIRGLYRGLGINIVGGAPASAVFFYCFDQSKKLLAGITGVNNSFMQSFLSGIMAEVVACLLFVPIDVIKERQQVMTLMKSYNYKNSIDAIRQIAKQEGVTSLYRAYGATILSFGPFTGISIALYDKLKYWFGYDERSIAFHQSLILSALSGSVASIVTNPIDVVKVRMQVQRAELKGSAPLSEGRFGYRNSLHGMKMLFNKEGFLGMFKGLSARITFGIISSGLNLSINDYVKFTLLKDFDKH